MTNEKIASDLFGEELVRVDGELVKNYNRSLENVVGKKTSLDSFLIDKRGYSFEVANELGQNYLSASPVSRYFIIVSPEQKDAPMLSDEFSLDETLIDELFSNYLAGIATVTRVDSMYGMFNKGISSLESHHDLLTLKEVKAYLDTPSGFIKYAKELSGLLTNLQDNPELLTHNHSAVPKRMLELFQKVGDIRGHNIENYTAVQAASALHAKMFGETYMFRHGAEVERKKVRRPRKSARFDAFEEPSYSTAVEKTSTLIVNDYDPTFNLRQFSDVDFIRLSDTSDIADFLLSKGYADYSPSLIGEQLRTVEDLRLIATGHNVVGMDAEQRNFLVYKEVEMLGQTREWRDLQAVKAAVENNHDLAEVAKGISSTARIMLMHPVAANESQIMATSRLMASVNPINFHSMSIHNQRQLFDTYSDASENLQLYIKHKIENHEEPQEVPKKTRKRKKQGDIVWQYLKR